MPNMPTSGKPQPWHAKPKQALEGPYNDVRWRKYRAIFLAANPVCVVCERPATVVDHIQTVAVRPDLFWTPRNHQPMCDACHNHKRATSDKA